VVLLNNFVDCSIIFDNLNLTIPSRFTMLPLTAIGKLLTY